MSKSYYIKQEQFLPVPIDVAWDFFSNPLNLSKITPVSLDFRITSDIFSKEIYPGQLITYKVKPLLGIPLVWISEITEVKKESLFIDEQRKGPYKLWHHEHYFKPVKGGTEMIDIVEYQVPFGIIGKISLPLVKKKLNSIFAYRRKVVTDLFDV